MKSYAGKIQGKLVLLTGLSVGIEKATAPALAAMGASIATVARRKANLEAETQYNVPVTVTLADSCDSTAPAQQRSQ